MSSLALEVALSVQDELAARADEAERLRRQQVDRARYEAELAQRRYLRVDPDNRLVAVTLESEWNNKLRALEAAKDDYERRRASDVLFERTSASTYWFWPSLSQVVARPEDACPGTQAYGPAAHRRRDPDQKGTSLSPTSASEVVPHKRYVSRVRNR
jgi:hypothetical protein